jgi:hypothetical protein
VAANGVRHVYEGCLQCRTPLTPGRWLPAPDNVKALPVGADNRTQNPPCQVCGQFGTELHHWAPREAFGDEADHWPTAWLCPECHSHWHRRVSRHVWRWVA